MMRGSRKGGPLGSGARGLISETQPAGAAFAHKRAANGGTNWELRHCNEAVHTFALNNFGGVKFK